MHINLLRRLLPVLGPREYLSLGLQDYLFEMQTSEYVVPQCPSLCWRIEANGHQLAIQMA